MNHNKVNLAKVQSEPEYKLNEALEMRALVIQAPV